MVEVQGNLYTNEEVEKYDYIGFTANSVVKSNGELVMGKGAALAFKKFFTYIDVAKVFGHKVSQYKGKDFYIVVEGNLFAFQTKRHYRDRTPIDLLVRSTALLRASALKYPDKKFALPYPAIGYGGLPKSQVSEIVKHLPDNVFLHTL